MASSVETAKLERELKRKREGAEQVQSSKKAKKHRKIKNEEGAENATSPLEASAQSPVAKSTSKKSSPKNDQNDSSKKQAQVNGDADPTESPLASRKNKKKEKKDKKQIKEEDAQDHTSVNAEPEATDEVMVSDGKEKKSRKQRRREEDKSMQSAGASSPGGFAVQDTSTQWTKPQRQGGRFLHQDPVFSPDEQFVFVATLKEIRIYSVETSLVSGVLPLVGKKGVIVSYAHSPTQPDHLYAAVATGGTGSKGTVSLWNWFEGSKVKTWDISARIRHLVPVNLPGNDQDFLYCHEVDEKTHYVNVRALGEESDNKIMDCKQIFQVRGAIVGIQVLSQGRFVIVATSHSILVGKRSKIQKTALQNIDYVWREFATVKRVTTFSAFDRTAADAKGQKTHIDLAVGDDEGTILLFEDLMATFAAIERSQRDSKDIGFEGFDPKRLHWHRDAVGSVKWSLDGNYLISGGDETVLVIWQLATGKQQYLPHLTAAIEHVTVGPSGASYALSLANNSVVVLSTTELEAKANLIGIQSRRYDFELGPRESNPDKYLKSIFRPVPMVINPNKPGQLLFTTPSSQPLHQLARFVPEPYIQTYDFTTQRPLSRQALTRNNATDPNMGPDGGKILEPDVKFLQISHDGQWLASVDVWVPPPADMGYLDEGVRQFNEEERLYRREVYLKIWKWNNRNEEWVLSTRTDAPHFFQDVSAHGEVFDLIADPSDLGFATIGEDGVARIWRPKTRLRSGVTVRGADEGKKALITWSLDHSIELSGKLEDLDLNSGTQHSFPLQNARLSFSEDGSVLAAGLSWTSYSDPGVVHVIDSETGTIRRSITEMDFTTLSAIGFVGHHLVTISDAITVWNMVSDELVYSVTFDTPGVDRLDRMSLIRLAVNEHDGTFAVALPAFIQKESFKSNDARKFKKTCSIVKIFDTHHVNELCSFDLREVALSLVSQKDTRGYIALDAQSAIRVINAKTSALQLPTPPPETIKQRLNDAQSTGHGATREEEPEESELEEEMDTETERLLQNSENDKPVVRPEQLQQIFDVGPSQSLPPVKDMFDAVVGLYARKTKNPPREVKPIDREEVKEVVPDTEPLSSDDDDSDDSSSSSSSD